MADTETDERLYMVVCNDEGQYSVWFADQPVPQGWRSVGKVGPQRECLEYIDLHWTDLRPRSLRE